MKLFMLLLFAHLIGDFVLQTGQLVAFKRKKILGLLLHSVIIFVVTFLVLLSLRGFYLAFLIGISHLIIDYGKIKLGERRQFLFFILDQMLHVIVILLVTIFFSGEDSLLLSINGQVPLQQIVTLLNGILLNTIISGWIIAIFFQSTYPAENFNSGLENAGKYIGYFERIIIMMMVLTNNITGIGFLVTAKSILRIGELTKDRDKKEAEYIILGTFFSFALALLWSYITKYWWTL